MKVGGMGVAVGGTSVGTLVAVAVGALVAVAVASVVGVGWTTTVIGPPAAIAVCVTKSASAPIKRTSFMVLSPPSVRSGR